MNLIPILKLTIFLVACFSVYRFLRVAGVLRTVKHEKISQESARKKLKNELLVKQQKQAVALLSWAGKKVNTKTFKYEVFEKSAQRLAVNLFDTVLNGVQLKGLINMIAVGSLLLSLIWTIIFGFSIFNALLMFVGLISLIGYQAIIDTIIIKKDKRLDEAFSDLFLMVYTSIIDDTGTPLIKCLNTFIRANKYKLIRYKKEDLKRVKEVMAFATYYTTLLTKLPEETATREVRKKYGTSSLIINFCTIVEQRLRGKDNRDKLNVFKQELLNKKARILEAKSTTLINRGELIVNSIYIILIEVILVSAIGGLPVAELFNR